MNHTRVESAPKEMEMTGTATMSMTVNSTAFQDGEPLPAKYTCDGDGVSPPLQWGPGPEGTRSYALICDDPDAPKGAFVHWVVYCIPQDVHSLPEHVPTTPTIPASVVQGTNTAGRVGYTAPCPPSGTHRYRFHIYALDMMPGLDSGVTARELMDYVEGHILAQGILTGTCCI